MCAAKHSLKAQSGRKVFGRSSTIRCGCEQAIIWNASICSHRPDVLGLVLNRFACPQFVEIIISNISTDKRKYAYNRTRLSDGGRGLVFATKSLLNRSSYYFELQQATTSDIFIMEDRLGQRNSIPNKRPPSWPWILFCPARKWAPCL